MATPVPEPSPPSQGRLFDAPGDLVQSLSDFARTSLPEPGVDDDPTNYYQAYRRGHTLIAQVLACDDRAQDANNILDHRNHIANELAELQLEHTATQQALTSEQQHSRQLHQLNVQLGEQLSRQSPHTAAPHYKESKMSDPEMFNGNRDKLRPFLTKLRLKLAEPNAFRDEQARLRYIIGRLEGAALNQVISFVTPDGVDFSNTEALITHLNTCFDDPDRTGTAVRKLQSIRQGTREFSAYFAEFQQYALQLNWNPDAIRASLKNGLAPELETALITVEEPADYSSYINLLTKIDSRMRAAKQKLTPRPTPSKGPAQHSGPRPSPTSGSSDAKPAPHPTSSNSGNYGLAPMDLSSNRKKLTPEERNRRITEGLCLYCGGAGHIANLCPNKQNGRLQASEAVLTPTGQPGINQNNPSPASEPKN